MNKILKAVSYTHLRAHETKAFRFSGSESENSGVRNRIL